jgi:transcriptional regulator with XRE-family HTH domain
MNTTFRPKKGGAVMALTLKALRINAGLDQKTAAERLNITPETLSNWERAKSFPTVPQISKIEALYNTTYNEINFLPTNIGLTEGE